MRLPSIFVSVAFVLALAACVQPENEGARTGDTVRGQNSSEMPTSDSDRAVDRTSEVFTSRLACDAAVAEGALHDGGREEGDLRLATWNIRWFPDGSPRAEGATDLDWLGCTLAFLDADIIALQEIKTGEASDVAWAVVTDALAVYVGGDWEVDLQSCGGNSQQHVGILWNADRVRLERLRDAWEMNGASLGPTDPCAGNLRPGRAAYVRSEREAGADFHIASVHLDSGRSEKDFGTRQIAYDRLDGLFQSLLASEGDEDLIVLGDFNTMGADGIMEEPTEIDQLAEVIANEMPGFELMPADFPCTEYYRGECGVLDHIVVAADMAEREASLAIVSGVCAARGGASFPTSHPPSAYETLSDHCPLVIDIVDQDRD